MNTEEKISGSAGSPTSAGLDNISTQEVWPTKPVFVTLLEDIEDGGLKFRKDDEILVLPTFYKELKEAGKCILLKNKKDKR